MKSIDEAIGTTKPYVMETYEKATARMADELMEGLSDEQLPRLVQAIMGLYLTGKAIRVNLSQGKAITTADDSIRFSPALFAPLDYVQLPESTKERTVAVRDMLDAAIELKFIGNIEGMLMLTGKGLQTIERIMRKEAMYS